MYGRGHSTGPRLATVGAWPVPWAPSCRRGGVAGPLGPVWPQWRCGRDPGPRLAAVGAWQGPWAPSRCRGVVHARFPWPCLADLGRGHSPGPCLVAVGAWWVPWVLSDRRGGVAGPWATSCCRGDVAGPLGLVWPLFGRGRAPGRICRLFGRGRAPGPRLAAVGAWPVPWVPSGRREVVARGDRLFCRGHGSPRTDVTCYTAFNFRGERRLLSIWNRTPCG